MLVNIILESLWLIQSLLKTKKQKKQINYELYEGRIVIYFKFKSP